MTIHAPAVFKVGSISCFMATGAFHQPVLPFKGVAGKRVIEGFYSLHLMKGYLGMTLGAILTEFIFMNILVTIRTFPEA